MSTHLHDLPRSKPGPDHGWRPGSYSTGDLADALLTGHVAGAETSHDRKNVGWKIRRLVDGDPDLQFGLRDLGSFSAEDVLGMMAQEAGFEADPLLVEGPTAIDPHRVLAACDSAGRRLAQVAERGERVLLATGHPAGLPILYQAVGELLEEHGAKLLRPLDGGRWHEADRIHQVRYLRGVAMLSAHGSLLHTHAPGPMERMLEEARPDIVVADHGFAGASIQAGLETISIVDVNDPAPVVAKRQGRTELVIVLDDNVLPEDYWPCFQAIARRFP